MADVNNVFISTGNSIIKEECIIPDELELNKTNTDISLEDSCKQTNKTHPVTKRDKAFVEKIRKRISDLKNMKCSQNVKDAVVKNTIAPIQKNIKSPALIQSHLLAKNLIQRALEKSNIEWTSPTISSKSNLKPDLQSVPKFIPPKSKDAPLILKLPMTEAESVIKIEVPKKDKSTLHVLDMKEKQIVITKNNLTEFKKEVVEADLEEDIANRDKRFYHAVCVTCKKLRQPNNKSEKCDFCQSIFHYECMRCRDTLSCKEEYYTHLENTEFCTELNIPSFLSSLSYTLAIRLEKNQCTVDDWKRMQELVSVVRKARMKFNRSKFNRIRSCCPVCDTAKPIENGTFYCASCKFSSVFKCLTCNRNYTSYTGAIYHAKNHLSKKAFFECNDCSFKHATKRELGVHISRKHLLEDTVKRNVPSVPARCPNCNLVIKTSSYWKKHSSICRKKIYYKCVLCSAHYLIKKDIIPHLKLAHQMSDSKVMKLRMQEIIQNRKNQEENKKRTLINSLITPFCIDCNILYGVLNVTLNYNCLECKKQVAMQCKVCQKTFKKYITAYNHIKNSCKKSKIASIEKKNNGPMKKLIKDKKCKKLKKDTKEMDSDVSENNTILEKDEMQLDENNVKIEEEDIEVFDGLLDFENFEVIIPNNIHQ